MPDRELFELAESGMLAKPDVLLAQVRRMLADPKVEGFSENFAAQCAGFRPAAFAGLQEVLPLPAVVAGKLDPRLADRLFGRRQRELCKPVIECHLLAVETAFSLKPAHLPTDFDSQPLDITKLQLRDSATTLAHGFQRIGHRVAQ